MPECQRVCLATSVTLGRAPARPKLDANRRASTRCPTQRALRPSAVGAAALGGSGQRSVEGIYSEPVQQRERNHLEQPLEPHLEHRCIILATFLPDIQEVLAGLEDGQRLVAAVASRREMVHNMLVTRYSQILVGDG